MSLVKKILSFPLERIKTKPGNIIADSLRNRTFYKSEEIDFPTDIEGLTYGEFKEKVGYIYFSNSGKVPDDILFLIASRKELENRFLNRIKSDHGERSKEYKKFKKTFEDIRSYRY